MGGPEPKVETNCASDFDVYLLSHSSAHCEMFHYMGGDDEYIAFEAVFKAFDWFVDVV